TGVSCPSPDPARVPAVRPGQVPKPGPLDTASLSVDFVAVTLSLLFGSVSVTERDFTFYDCTAVKQLSGSMPCRGCVLSRWGCNWCVHQHACTHKASCEEGVLIYNQLFKLPTSAPPTTKPPTVPPTAPPPTTVATTLEPPAPPAASTLMPPTAAPAQTTPATPALVPLLPLPSAVPAVPEPQPVAPPVPVEEHTAARQDVVAPTAAGSQAPAVTPADTAVVTETEAEPVTGAAEAPAEEAEPEAAMPLTVPWAAPPTEPPGPGAETEAFSGLLPPPAPFPVDRPPEAEDADGERAEPRPPEAGGDPAASYPRLMDADSELDYQYDVSDGFLPGDEGSYVSWGSSACPCVEKVQGSSLLPVGVERKITLLARNLQLYQDQDYECVLVIEGRTVVVEAYVELDQVDSSVFYITCQLHKEYQAMVYVKRRDTFHVDSAPDLRVTLYDCSAGRADCSRCRTAHRKYECAWCGGGGRASCLYSESCGGDPVQLTCPAPLIHHIEPLSGLLEGGTQLTIWGSNLGQKAEDILHSVTVARVPCSVIPSLYQVSTRIVCRTRASGGEKQGQVSVEVSGGEVGLSGQVFSYQDPFVMGVSPERGPKAGGTALTITGRHLLTGRPSDLAITVGGVPCSIVSAVQESSVACVTGASNRSGEQRVTLRYGASQRHLHTAAYRYSPNPNVTRASPANSFLHGGRLIYLSGHNLDVVQEPRMVFTERCEVNSSSLIVCRSPAVDDSVWGSKVTVEFLLDNLRFPFSPLSGRPFRYEPNPLLHPLNQQEPLKGENLDLAITKEEVVVLVGEGVCAVKTLTRNHLYCEPPPQQPGPGPHGKKREGSDSLPEFTVQMGNLNFSLGKVQYDTLSLATFPMEARKSKQALRDYKKVQIQLENLETSVRDRCKKEFTDLMTEMMDMSSDLVGSGIPFLDYRKYAERIFFPGHRESPLRRDLDVQESRRQTVEQGLVQLSNLLNSKLFLTKFIHTLEGQRTFSPRDRAYVASLLTVALHGKLEYFTDILKTLLNDLVEQYVAKNPKLMLRRTETVVEKLLTNWMSICLYAFLRDSAGESLYMLFRAIKHQVEKGPVDAVTGKAKYTLNDNRLLREDLEYKTLTLNVLAQGGGLNESQPLPSKVLDIDTISQVKEKLLEQVYKGTTFSQRPHGDALDLEWRSGVAGHLILSDEDLTSVVQGNWKRLNTLQHYKVPDGATVALVPRHSKHIHHDNHDYVAGEKTPMLEDADEGGVRLWHLVKASEEPELPKHRRGSLRERERAKAIPEIYLTRLLSMKGTLQKFVDDLFTVILSTSRPVPLAVKYFFDLLDDQAGKHGISDPETIHIWKTNSLPLRFWINMVKNPQLIFDVQASDHVDAVLSVIAQTFMDSCTVAEHKLGRDSPINKLLYARDIPRYKQMVERYYADIRQTISASDQEMNSALAELSRNYSGELNYLIITALEEDPTAQKLQLGYRLQQIAAAVENKVTDL
ncbi:hypothetical protein NHX12_030515, partial [Muraenolepis orangiensis]